MVPLQAIYMFERGKENSIDLIDVKEAVSLILKQTILPRNPVMVDKLFIMLENV